MAQFYDYKNKKSYKELDYTCKKCDWIGVGEQAKDGMDSSSGFIIHCPKCDDYIDWIDITVSLDDLIKYGDEEEKASALERLDFLNRVWEAELKTPDQLPDIDADEIIITLREEETLPQEEKSGENDGANIVLYWKDQELWRELRSFEYYPRYLDLGKILKEKYGDRLIDFEAAHTVYLGGDRLSAFEQVDKFRKSLKRWNDALGYRVFISKTIGRGVGLVCFDTSNRNTKWLDDLISQNKATPAADDMGRPIYHIKKYDIIHMIIDNESVNAHFGRIEYPYKPTLSGLWDKILREDEALSKCSPDEILSIRLLDLRQWASGD